jgi:hypothetical protein
MGPWEVKRYRFWERAARKRFVTEYAPRPMASVSDEVIDYTRGGADAPSIYVRPEQQSRIPGVMRHD